MKEIWKDIPSYIGLYQASNLGRIRSIDCLITFRKKNGVFNRFRKGRILKHCNNRYGYPMVVLTKPDHRMCHSVHRLVMLAFIGHSDLTVNHKNGIKTDNRLDNLEYLTMSENLFHAHKIGLKKATKIIKYDDSYIEMIKKSLEKNSYRWFLAAKELGLKKKDIEGAIKRYCPEYFYEIRKKRDFKARSSS
jgi:hypothetical protein